MNLNRSEKCFFLIFALLVMFFSMNETSTMQDCTNLTISKLESNVTNNTIETPKDASTYSTITPTPTPTPSPTPTINPTKVPSWNRSHSDNGLPSFKDHSGDFLQIIKDCKEYYAYNGFKYCMCPGKRSIPPGNSHKTSCSEHNVSSSYVTDCSTYVSWVLYEYGLSIGRLDLAEYFSSQKNSAKFHKIANENENEFFEVIPKLSDCMPGDILIYSGHVEFFHEFDKDGHPIVWSCGSGKYVNHSYPERSSRSPDKVKKILRLIID